MMRHMRDNPALILGVIVFVVGAFIGSIFLVYGLKSTGSIGGPSGGSVVAVVEGEDILYTDYLNAYNNQANFFRQFYPSLSLGELEERFQLKQTALDTLVNSRLLLREAEGMGLQASDEELRMKIEGTPMFQEGGRFSNDTYRQALASSRITPTAYEESQRSGLLIDKIRALVTDSVRISEEETREAFGRERDKVRLALLSLPVENYRGWVSVTEEEVEARFEEDPEKYRRPERIRLAYLSLGEKNISDSLIPSEEDLKAYYEENEESYRRPEQVRARHILIKVPEGASAEEEAGLRERIDFVLAKVREGADFAGLAGEFSQDGSGPAGGDLGYFERGQMVPAFDEAAFSLDAGEVSDVVRTEFGFHVIMVEDVREAGSESFDEAREKVEEAWRTEESQERLSLLVGKVNDELFDEEFETVAETYGLEVRRAERLTPDDLLPGLGFRPDVSRALFALEEGEVSDVYRQPGGDYYTYLIEEKKADYLPDLEEAEAEVRAELVGEKVIARAREESRSLLDRIRGGVSLEEAASAVKGKIQETALFTRNGFVPEAGGSGEIFGGAFRLGEGEFGGPAVSGDKVWVYRVEEVSTALDEEFAEEKKDLAARLRKEKQDQLFESWLRQLRELRSVEIDESLTNL
jgi:peptidyl-prolyl cis-trans isomerase D